MANWLITLLVPIFPLNVSHALTTSAEQSFLAPIDHNLLLFLGIEDGIATNAGALKKCSAQDVAAWEPNTCPLAAYVKTHARPLQVEEILSDRVQMLYFGETHLSQGSKQFLLSLLPELKIRGFATFAMEMFNISQQAILDDYFAGRVDLAAIRASLQANWSYDPAGYLQLIEASRALGIRVLAIDDRNQVAAHPQIENLRQRDQIMAARIAQELKANPNAKIFALTGALHAQCVLSKNRAILSQSELVFEATGVATRCLTIREQMRPRDPVTSLHFQSAGSEAAFLPTDRSVAYSDGYVLLPKNYLRE